jgi:two-component system CitB family sensor kinase
LCSIIGNLIENAIDELIKKEDGKISVKINSDDEKLRIIVTDNGMGIDKEIKERLFERGVTTKEGKRGFGLWIIRQAIHRANGEIRFYENHGTTWDIHIPLERSCECD